MCVVVCWLLWVGLRVGRCCSCVFIVVVCSLLLLVVFAVCGCGLSVVVVRSRLLFNVR